MAVTRRTTGVVSLLALTIVSLGSVSIANAGSNARSAQEARIARAALAQALDARQRVLVPSRVTGPQALSRPEGAEMLASGQQALARYFIGKQLAKETLILSNGVATLQKDATFRVLGGGADHLVVSRSDVNRDYVRLVGTVRTWQKMAQVQEHGHLVVATPSNVLDFTATISVSGSASRITNFSWSFHPGSEP